MKSLWISFKSWWLLKSAEYSLWKLERRLLKYQNKKYVKRNSRFSGFDKKVREMQSKIYDVKYPALSDKGWQDLGMTNTGDKVSFRSTVVDVEEVKF